MLANQSAEQATGYQLIGGACRQTNHRADLAQFVRLAAAKIGAGQAADCSSSPKSAPAGNQREAPEEPEEAAHIADKSASIRYHQFQAPNWQNAELIAQNLAKFEAKNLVSWKELILWPSYNLMSRLTGSFTNSANCAHFQERDSAGLESAAGAAAAAA